METIGNVVVGKAQARQDASAHSAGVREGNKRKSMMREPGLIQQGPVMATATARRSTGINARGHGPIDPRMPVLTPA